MEVVFKLAKRRARIFETPIRYVPRTAKEGKKIRPWDGLLALFAMFHFWIIDDLYHDDEYGSRILVELERTKNFNAWMANMLRPYLGDRVLEIGAGIGNLTSQFIPRELYLASDINPHYLRYLRAYSAGKPYLHVRKVDVQDDADFVGLEGKFDTAVALNVVEHVPEPESGRRQSLSRPGAGRARGDSGAAASRRSTARSTRARPFPALHARRPARADDERRLRDPGDLRLQPRVRGPAGGSTAA